MSSSPRPVTWTSISPGRTELGLTNSSLMLQHWQKTWSTRCLSTSTRTGSLPSRRWAIRTSRNWEKRSVGRRPVLWRRPRPIAPPVRSPRIARFSLRSHRNRWQRKCSRCRRIWRPMAPTRASRLRRRAHILERRWESLMWRSIARTFIRAYFSCFDLDWELETCRGWTS